MHNNPKIFILIPDGVSLRNFAYTKFNEIGQSRGFDNVYWNNTSFDLQKLGLKQVVIRNVKMHPLVDLYKTAKLHIELKLNEERSGDTVFRSYLFPLSYTSAKVSLKSLYIRWLAIRYGTFKGLATVRRKLRKLERSTAYYKECMDTLQSHRPAMVFCTSQRSSQSIAPITAAQDLGIPTATFIFSWDNLPKATLILETDFYFVWSDFMKSELLHYYPNVNEAQVVVTGTPQFELHTDPGLLLDRAAFFADHGLDSEKRYICYSGDDITTSPNDPQYLTDVAEAVRKLNTTGLNLGIIFRRCPVDYSNRYEEVLNRFSDVIRPIAPKWRKIGESWNTVLPTKEDISLQLNTIHHSEMVINLGSSMVFDYATFRKPCAYINYDVANNILPGWSVEKVYKFVHFRSMPDGAVIWLNSAEGISKSIEKALSDHGAVVQQACKWFEIINRQPWDEASKRIWESCEDIIAHTGVRTSKV